MEMLIAQITTLANDLLAVGDGVGRKHDRARLSLYITWLTLFYED